MDVIARSPPRADDVAIPYCGNTCMIEIATPAKGGLAMTVDFWDNLRMYTNQKHWMIDICYAADAD